MLVAENAERVCLSWLRLPARWRRERRQPEVDGEISAHARSAYLLNLELRHMYTLHSMVVFVTSFKVNTDSSCDLNSSAYFALPYI